MQRITPCLWFDSEAEEAARFYTSILPNSKLGRIARYGDAGAEVSGRPVGSVMTVTFELEGQEFMALNGGPLFQFSEAISFSVSCASQADVDELWAKLGEGGEPGPCGWLKDRYGLSWQIVPTRLEELLSGADAAASERVMKAMLQMSKLDLAELERAAGEG